MSADIVAGSAAHVATNVITGAIHIVNYQDEALNVTTTGFARSQLFAPGTFDANGYAIAEESQTLTLYLTADQVQCSSAECQQLTIGDTSFEICYSMYGDQSCVPHIPSAGYSPMPTGVTATSVSFVDEEGYESVAIWICSRDRFIANGDLCPEQVVENTWDIRGPFNFTYSEFAIVNDTPWPFGFWWNNATTYSTFMPDFMPATHNGILGVSAHSSAVFPIRQITAHCSEVTQFLNVYWENGFGYFATNINGDLKDNTKCLLSISQDNSHICPVGGLPIGSEVWAQWTKPQNEAGSPRITLYVCTHEEIHKNAVCPGIQSYSEIAGTINTVYPENTTLCEQE
eukprot:Clim_evm2s158 gene=Clim_evmTU2s158